LLRTFDQPRPRLLAALIALVWLLASGLHDVGLVLVFFPAAALFIALLLGRAPGEALLTRLRERRAIPRRRARVLQGQRRPTKARRISGGTLLARRLAGRAPPLWTFDSI